MDVLGISIDTLIIALTWVGIVSGVILVWFVFIVLFLLLMDWCNNRKRRMCESKKDKIG